MTVRGGPDRYVEGDSSGGGGGGGSVTQGTTPWVVDDPNTQAALASILALLTGGIPVEPGSTPLDVNIVGGGGGGDATAANQVTEIGHLAAIQTAVELLDNIVSGSEAQVDIVAPVPAGTNIVGGVRTYGVSGRMIDSDDQTTVITVKTVHGVATAMGDNVVLAAVSGKKIRVLSYGLQNQETGAQTVQFQDNGTATTRGMRWVLIAGATQADGVVRNPGGDGHFYFETDAGVGLDLNLGNGLDVSYELTYVEVD